MTHRAALIAATAVPNDAIGTLTWRVTTRIEPSDNCRAINAIKIASNQKNDSIFSLT
jgi:hypothetical protein